MNNNTVWNPSQYLRFADHRLRPALELLERIPLTAPELVYDLGCGAGQLTRIMAERWPQAQIYGVDSSRQMLEQAAAEPSRVQWCRADIATWSPQQAPDLIYSNACLHWLDGHGTLFPGLLGLLRPGGYLAVQMPLSWTTPSHRLMRETLADGGPGGSTLGTTKLRRTMARNWVEKTELYYDLLVRPAKSLDIWETEYLQVLQGVDPVLEWVKSTGLRPILNSLDEADRALFLNEYAGRLRLAYPMRADGKTLYPFRRLFIVAEG